MEALNPAFRTLLLKKIRGLTDEQLSAYEGLVALRLELTQMLERNPYDQRLQRQIEQAGKRAYEIISRFENEFNVLHNLWVKRQRQALRQGNYFQFPFNLINNSLKKFICYCSTRWHGRGKQTHDKRPGHLSPNR